MKPAPLALAAILLAGCAPTGTPPAPAAEEAAAAPVALPHPPAVDLAGQWRVAGIDGEPFDRPYGIALTADAQRLWWEPVCARQGRDYAISGNAFSAIPPASEPPQPVCDIAFPAELAQIWSALDAADRIERTAANGVRIAGGGRSVTLFSQ